MANPKDLPRNPADTDKLGTRLSNLEPTLVFYRDDSKREIDLIDLTEQARPQAFEIKSGATYRDTFARHLRSVGSELGIPAKDRSVVYHGSERYDTEGASVVPAEEFLLRES